MRSSSGVRLSSLFIDLMERAGDLIRRHDAMRQALGVRYRHRFVDEFQDTNPLQTEIVFRLCSDEPVADWHAPRVRAGVAGECDPDYCQLPLAARHPPVRQSSIRKDQ
jgi:superfamily I DNA/RNA helicase